MGADADVGLDLLLRIGDDVRLVRLPPRVLLAELLGEPADLLQLRLVAGQEQARGEVGRAHAAGGVDARRDDEGHMEAVDDLVLQARRLEQRAQAHRVRPLREALEPELGDDAVLADQRHHVGHGADRGELQERRQPLLPVEPLAQRLHDLEGDADARKVLVRVGAVGPLRVDHRQGRRQLGLRFVVVGDDEVDAELAGTARRLGAPDATVHRHDHAHAVGVQPLHRRGLQAVAVPHPFGDEVRDVTSEQFQRATQDDRRGHAVDVVVAVDRDPLPALERGAQPIDRGPHVGEAIRVVQLGELRIEEPVGRLGVGMPPMPEKARDDRRHVERDGQRLRGRLVTHDGVPDQCPHGAAMPTRGVRRPYRRSRRRPGRCVGTSRTGARGDRPAASP